MSTKSKIITRLSVLVVIFILSIILGMFEVVRPGNRGVKIRLGNVHQTVLDEGMHFKTPFIDSIVQIDTKVQKISIEADSSSNDLQQVNTLLAVNYRLTPSQVNEIYKNIGEEDTVAYKIIKPAVEEVVKSVTAKYTAEQLITKRGEVRTNIKVELAEKLKPSYVEVTDVSIENFEFSAEFDKAIEAKVTAEQKALEAQNKVAEIEAQALQAKARAEGEASAILQKAQAEAQGIRDITSSLTPEYVEYIKAQQRNGNVPQFYGNGQSFLMDIGNVVQ